MFDYWYLKTNCVVNNCQMLLNCMFYVKSFCNKEGCGWRLHGIVILFDKYVIFQICLSIQMIKLLYGFAVILWPWEYLGNLIWIWYATHFLASKWSDNMFLRIIEKRGEFFIRLQLPVFWLLEQVKTNRSSWNETKGRQAITKLINLQHVLTVIICDSCAVHSCNWYMEYWMHICWNSDRKATFPWQECSSSTGSHNWLSWHSTSGCDWKGLSLNYYIYQFCYPHGSCYFLFASLGSKWEG